MNYIVDTNILLEYPDFIKEPKRIVLTYSVVRELDSKKNVPGGLGFNSRIVSRYLDDCRKAGNIAEGVDTESGGWIIVVMDDESVHTDDSLVALGKSMTEQNLACTLLSNDVNVRIKAACNGVATDGWGHDKKTAAVYGKIPEFWVSDNVVKTLFSTGKIDLTGFGHIALHSYALLRSEINSNSTAIVFNDGLDLVVVGNKNKKIFGLSPKNIDQTCAFDALCRDNIPLVTLSGPAGSGKSLLAIAAGLDALIEQRKVDKIIIIRAPIPVGKDVGFLPGPLAVETPVLTPSGWSTMGELKESDLVIARNGKPTKVLGKYNKGMKESYLVKTADGAEIIACKDHVWQTQTYSERKHNLKPQLRTTQEIFNTLTVTAQSGKSEGTVRFNHFLPRVDAVQFEAQKMPVPAYTLGALLGDGSICDSISLIGKDRQIFDRVEREIADLGCQLGSSHGMSQQIKTNKNHHKNNKPAQLVKVVDKDGSEKIYHSVGVLSEETGIHVATIGTRCKRNTTVDGKTYSFVDSGLIWSNPLKDALSKLNLVGKKATDKFIPACYKWNSSVEDRIALLQGLMDTDGTIKKNSEMSYTTVSKQLAEDVQEIVRSLGGRCILASRDRVGKQSVYNGRTIETKEISFEFNISLPSHICPFHIDRKANRHISRSGKARTKKPFMHGNAIVSVTPVGMREVACILVEDSEHLFTVADYTVTHNTMQDKMQAWAGPMYDNIDVLMNGNKKNIDMYFEKGLIEVVPTTFLRGRSLNRTFVILDEGQGLSAHEMKTVATRIGEGSRLVVTGDLEQIDNPKVSTDDNGLALLVGTFKDTKWAVCLDLIKGERSGFSAAAADLL